jgi:hypothetical protein
MSGSCTVCDEPGATFGYGTSSGTSMAAPHVAGVAALLWSFKPDATAQEIINAMEQSALDLGEAGHDDRFGYGLVDAMEALKVLNGGPLLQQNLGGTLDQQPLPLLETGVPESDVDLPNSPPQSSPPTLEVAPPLFPPVAADSTVECGEGFFLFDLLLTTDSYASETSWELVQKADGRQILSALSGSLENNRAHRWRRCVPNSCYTFIIYDRENDG